MAKYLGKDRACFYIGGDHNGVRKPCVVAEEGTREIKDNETYLITIEGKIQMVKGVELALR